MTVLSSFILLSIWSCQRAGAFTALQPRLLRTSRAAPAASTNDSNDSFDEDYYEEYFEDLGAMWRIEPVDKVFDDEDMGTPEPPSFPNPLLSRPNIPNSWFVGNDEAVAARVNVDVHQTCVVDPEAAAPAFVLAGPRERLAFDPFTARAALVTCGGLCPGLNTVVREVVMCLRRQYGVQSVYGIPEGYRGFLNPDSWRELDEDVVANYHNLGGSVLGSSRGGHDTDAIVNALVSQNVNLLFIVGGDGTIRGAAKICQEIKRRNLPIAVAVIPKTIDNDVPLVDRTFGFETAVDAARNAIQVANVESEGFPLGLGIVKVMGRNSGFIAMHATLGSRVVDLCLVPEVNFFLDGPGGVVDHLAERLLQNDKAVVVVAEGAGQQLIAEERENGEPLKDLSGNVLLEDIGPWLASKLKERLTEKLKGKTMHADSVYTKYIDPSYLVRGVPPVTADNVYCTKLAHNCVHGALSGYTNFVVGSVNTRECYVPIRLVVNKRNVIDTERQSLWEYVVFDTGQPCFSSEDNALLEPIDGDVIVSASGGVILELESSS